MSPIYIEGLFLTASSPSRTCMLFAEYCCSACFISSFSIIFSLAFLYVFGNPKYLANIVNLI